MRFLQHRALIIALLVGSTIGDKKGTKPKLKKNEASRCESGLAVEPNSKHKVNIKFPLRKPEQKCYWGFYAEGGCTIQLSCKVDMPKSDDCENANHYVKVTDGSFGSKTYCGTTKFDKIMPSEGLRHLFLVVESNRKSGFNGIQCSVTCVKSSDPGERLTKNIDRKREQCVCGLQNQDDRIVGGEDAKENEFPWQTAIVKPGTRSPSCGSTVINERFILTAAHCFWFEDKTPDKIEVLARATLLDMTKKKSAKDTEWGKDGSIRSSGYDAKRKTDKDEKTQRYQVLEIINHPLFNKLYDYDYALLRVHKKIKLNEQDAPTPICLPPADIWDEELANWVGKNLTVTGWGLAKENAGGTTRQLQKLDVPFMSQSQCVESNPDLITDRMICAGYDYGEKDACTGDSGGPLIKQMPNNQWRQVGVVSWGEGCARAGKPGVYSRVTEMIQWIHLHADEMESKWCLEDK